MSSSTPVDSFDRSIDDFRSLVRDRMPFTFIAYRSFIPEKNDDWYYLATKVAWLVFVGVHLMEFAAKLSIFLALVPLIPLILDAVWLASRWVDIHAPISSKLLKVAQTMGFVAFSAIGVAFLFDQVRV